MHGQNGANGQPADSKEKFLLQQGKISSSPRSAAAPPIDSPHKSSFYCTKDGRKIEVGECALFQAGNAQPFIGILRKVTTDRDTTVRLRVNWLYRPADIKLAKGIPIDAAPNEIFYSFHKDDTPAASLLHPCRVAFLRKGVELPTGVSSFVCRRVYDTTHKRLWWLTDRDYTDEHQEEVDQLLTRTKLEMQAAIQQQPGARSPRALAVSSHADLPGKGKKRERSDSGHEPGSTATATPATVAAAAAAGTTCATTTAAGAGAGAGAAGGTAAAKRAKGDDSESSFVKSSTKPEEIASIVDKDGGLASVGGVEKLVSLMQQDRNDGIRKPIEVALRRIMLAGVVASTDKQECRDRLVQLGGLAVLDDWLQEAHKGKSGGDSAELDKILDELLLTLLRALQKLPVDLDALKTCAVGKSVNNLKSHRTVEIQKRARKLVETWKKRVGAEVKQSGEKIGKTTTTTSASDPLQPLAKDAKSSSTTKFGPSSNSEAAPAKSVGSATSKSGTTASSKENSPNNSGSNEIQGLSLKEEKSYASPAWSSAPVTSACKEPKPNRSSSSKVDAAAAASAASIAAAAAAGNGSAKVVMWSRTNASANTAERPERSSGETETPPSQRLILRFPNPGKSPARANGDATKVSSPKVLDRSSSSGLEGGGSHGRASKHHEISSEKRHRSDSKGGGGGGGGGEKSTAERSEARKEKSSHRENNNVNSNNNLAAASNVVDGVSTARSVVTEENTAEQENTTSSACPPDPPPPPPQQQQQHQQQQQQNSMQEPAKTDLRRQSSRTSDEVRRAAEAESEKKSGEPKPVSEKLQETAKSDASKPDGSPASDEDPLEVARMVAKEIEEGYGDGQPRSSGDTDEVKDDQPASLEEQEQLPAQVGGDTSSPAEPMVTSDESQQEVQQPVVAPREDTPMEEAGGGDAGGGGGGGGRPLFDLNEGFPSDDTPETAPPPPAVSTLVTPVAVPPAAPFGSLSAPIPVMASTTGTFIPPSSLKATNKDPVGWRGAAATSAFRPAEKKGKAFLDIDLNVAEGDESGFGVSEMDTTSAPTAARSFLSGFPSTSAAGGAEKKTALDLNQESEEGGSLRLRPPGGASSSAAATLRNFDLNDGPAFEDHPPGGGGGGREEMFFRNLSKPKASSSNPVISGNVNNGELLNVSWLSVPGVGIPGFPASTAGRTDQQSAYSTPPPQQQQQQQQQHPFMNGGSFSADLYRAAAAAAAAAGGGGGGGGPPASTTLQNYQQTPQAAAAAAAAAAALYSYPGFSFSSSFPFSAAAATFVAPSPYVANASIPAPSLSSISTNSGAFGRPPPPYFMAGAGGDHAAAAAAAAGVDATSGSGGAWGRRSLDLNNGPDPAVAAAAAAAAANLSEHHPDQAAAAARQNYVIPSLDEQMRAFHQAAAIKRKEPETGWDVYRGYTKWR